MATLAEPWRAACMSWLCACLRRSGMFPESTDTLGDHFYSPEERREMIALCDYIVATAPLTEETRHMISDAEFAVMKPTAVVINVGRGPVIEEAAAFPSIPDFMANWSRRNQCGPNPIESAIAADVTRLQYTHCASDADVVLYTIKGEGHQWPGGKRVAAEWMLGPYSRSIDATRQMWAFFREHHLTRK